MVFSARLLFRFVLFCTFAWNSGGSLFCIFAPFTFSSRNLMKFGFLCLVRRNSMGTKIQLLGMLSFCCVFFWGPAGASCLGASGHGDLRFVAILIASGACLGAAQMMGKHKRSNDFCLRVLSFVQNSFLTPGWGAMILHVFLFLFDFLQILTQCVQKAVSGLNLYIFIV